MPDGRACLHGTAVAIDGAALLLVGPSGVGKSGVAAQMMGYGAMLVCDDLAILATGAEGLVVSAPVAGPKAIALRGFNIVRVRMNGPARLRAILRLGRPVGRLPEMETTRILGHDILVLNHLTTSDVAAKARLWLMAER